MLIFISRFPWIKKLSLEEKYSRGFHAISFENEIAKKTVGELAELLQDAAITNDSIKRTIVEHTLNVRLGDIQANASMWSGRVTVLGSVLAVLVTFELGQLFANTPSEVVCNCNCQSERQPKEKPIPRTIGEGR